MEPSPTTFDAAAAAARFCAKRLLRNQIRRTLALLEVRLELDRDRPTAIIAAAAWREYRAAGGTLAELYGVSS